MVTAGSTDAQNLLKNPNFDSGLSGWTEYPGSFGDCTWDPANRSRPDSGCANFHIDKSGQINSRFRLQQCVSADGIEEFVAEALHLVPCGQSGAGFVMLRLSYMDADGTFEQSPSNCLADGRGCANWNRRRCTYKEVPLTADFVCVILEVSKVPQDATFRAAFDEVLLAPVLILDDGFESGNLSLWSGHIP